MTYKEIQDVENIRKLVSTLKPYMEYNSEEMRIVKKLEGMLINLTKHQEY